jgi:hypothetical protein
VCCGFRGEFCDYGAKKISKGVSKETTSEKAQSVSSFVTMSYRYLLLQHVTDRDKDVGNTIDRGELLSSGDVLSDEATFSGMLTNIIYEEQPQAEPVLCYVQKYGKLAETTVTGVVYLDLLEQYIIPVLQKEGSNDILFQ